MSKNKQMEVLRFIELYRSHEVLWNTDLESYKRNDLKAKAYESLARKMHMSVEKVKKKIKSLRTAYRCEKSKVEKSQMSKTGHRYIPSVYWYNEMSFLDASLSKQMSFIITKRENKDEVPMLESEMKMLESEEEDFSCSESYPSSSRKRKNSPGPNRKVDGGSRNFISAKKNLTKSTLGQASKNNNTAATQKCRTCLKSSTKTFPLTKRVIGCTQEITYAHILKEYIQFNCKSTYERHLPQFLCFLCCSQLKSTYMFIQQAKQSNSKLINDLTKQLCLQEEVIDLPQLEYESPISIKENNDDLEDQYFISNEDSRNHGDNLTEQIIEYDIEDNYDTNKAFKEEPALITEEIIEFDVEDDVEEIEFDNFSTVSNEDSAVMNSTIKIETVESADIIESPVSNEQMAKDDSLIKPMHTSHDDSESEYLNILPNEKLSSKEQEFPCRFCNHVARTQSGLKYHHRYKHPTEYKRLKCKYCKFNTGLGKHALLNHIKTAHKEVIKAFREELNNDKTGSNEEDSTATKSKEETHLSDKIETVESTDLIQCSICNEQITNRDKLINHMRVYHDKHDVSDENLSPKEQKFPCRFCNHVARTQSGLKYHHRYKHPTEYKRLKCKYCKFSTNLNKHVLLNHINTVHKEVVTNCSVEEDNVNTRSDEDHAATNSKEEAYLSNNIETVESADIIQCTVCNEEMANGDELINHTRIYHDVSESEVKLPSKEETFQCQFCDHVAKTQSGLKYHHRFKHPTEYKTLKCKFCSFSTGLNKYDLLNHIKAEHKELIKALRSKAISNKDESINANNDNELNDNYSENNLITTQTDGENISDSNDNEYDKELEELSNENFIRNMLNMRTKSAKHLVPRCDDCGKFLKNYKSLLNHKLHVHKRADTFSLCPFCDKKCKRETDLRIHIRQMHGPLENRLIPKPRSKEKRFMCAECSYTCTTSTVLNIHIRVHHTFERPYKCDMCPKTYVVQHDLTKHRYSHTGERPFKCPICLKDFSEPSGLRKHKRLHVNSNQFKCEDCGKVFTQSYNLSVHKRTHLKGIKLNCSVCGKYFKNKSMLNIHQINENHFEEVA